MIKISLKTKCYALSLKPYGGGKRCERVNPL